MKFDNTEVFNFDGALRGLRNPLESWSKSDSYPVTYDGKNANRYLGDIACYRIGENDMKLAQKLILAGDEHAKFMRQIFVSVDITAPLYWWKEFDTYKIGTVANSTSTMHKLATTPITLECFEVDDFNEGLGNYFDCACNVEGRNGGFLAEDVQFIINLLENLRQTYLETNDKRYWKELIRWLPSGWLQTRTVTMSYANLRNMRFQRRFHKQTEWSVDFMNWIDTLPYSNELIKVEDNE